MNPREQTTKPEQSANQPATSGGWFRAMRGSEPMELLATNKNAFILAYVIAQRGQYQSKFNRYGLKLGEALLGDFRNYDMTHREYRTAIDQLEEWGFATFKKTNQGTIGWLADTRLFSIFRLESDNQNDKQTTNDRQTDDNYQDHKNIRAKDKESAPRLSSEASNNKEEGSCEIPN